MRKAIILLAALALTACSARALLSQDVVRSEMVRNPEASYLDGLEGKLKWNYTTGLELQSFLDAAMADKEATKVAMGSEGTASDCGREATEVAMGSEGTALDCGREATEVAVPSKGIGPYELALEGTAAGGAGVRYIDAVRYVDAWYDAIIDSTGKIGVNYKKSNYSLDHICPGRTLFALYDITGKEKYRAAMDTLYAQLQSQPRTPEGGFWHKKIYPNQMWLDGLYMAQPFYAEYTARYVPDSLKAANFEDTARQFDLAWTRCYDPSTDLLRHAWDSSCSMFWCDATTGQSAHAWGRALGWYAMALVEVIPWMPEGALKLDLTQKLDKLCNNIMPYADPETRMWYQVLDRPGQEGNYLEATASAMFTYALLKGCRNGWIKGIKMETARSIYRDLLVTFVSYDPSTGLVDLNRCCEVAGLGGKENRSGTYDYYINEKIRSNDPKGIGPLIWAALEYEKL